MIKEGNERITITLRPQDKELIDRIKELKGYKTNGLAIRYLFETFYIMEKITK